jgi:hypothetical protein
MALREAAPIPGAFDFTRFVASSITFMTHLSEVSIYFDDKRLAKLTKIPGAPRTLEIPKGLKRSSGSNIMNATGIKSTRKSTTTHHYVHSLTWNPNSSTHQSGGYAMGIHSRNKEEETTPRHYKAEQVHSWWLFVYILVLF